MKHRVITAILISLGLSLPGIALAKDGVKEADLSAPAVYQTKLALRDLWVEHVFWVRNFVFATHSENAAAAKIAEGEIVTNAKAIASTIQPFYGDAASDALFNLLAGHWGAIKAYNDAALAGDKRAKTHAVDKLTANAQAIAKFLNGANPYLPEATVFTLLAAHGGHHVAQIGEVKSGDFEAEAKTWAAMRKHMFVISDAIVGALAKQFPEKF